jgi:putative acetyltransferase
MTTEIREEHKQDHEAVYTVNELAFKHANEARLVDALRKSAAFIPALSLVAVADQTICGHLLFTKILIKNDSATYESLALAPVAVLPEYQQKGVGSALIRAGLQKAKELAYDSVIVLGHEHYYPKFGFEPAEKWQIKAPFDVPSNVFMALELKPGALEKVSGTVEYAKEFESV